MLITIFSALHRWLLEKRLDVYIKVAKALAHPEALEIVKKLVVGFRVRVKDDDDDDE